MGLVRIQSGSLNFMPKNNRFVGEHSMVLINLDRVLYAQGGQFAGSKIKIYMPDGLWIELEGWDADRFRAAWREQE